MKTIPLYHLKFDVKGVNNETRDLATLYDGVFIAKKMGRGEGHKDICKWPRYLSQTI